MATVARLLGRVSLVLVALAVLLAAAFYGFSGSASRPGESGPRSIEMEALKSSKRSRKVTICHRKGNGRYVRITVSRDEVPAHRRHGDIVPAPEGGCPGPYGYNGGGGDGDDRDRRERDGRRRARRQGKDD
jgi:hypothetical protein